MADDFRPARLAPAPADPIDRHAWEAALDGSADGILLLDAAGSIRHANAVARDLLARRDGLVLRDGRLGCVARKDTDRLRLVLKRVVASGAETWAVAHRAERRPLLLAVAPVPRGGNAPSAALILRVRDPDRVLPLRPELLRDLLDLTRREAEVLLALLDTPRHDEAAVRLGIGTTTLRTHLHHAYDKLDVHDHAGLLRLLMRYGLRPRAPDTRSG